MRSLRKSGGRLYRSRRLSGGGVSGVCLFFCPYFRTTHTAHTASVPIPHPTNMQTLRSQIPQRRVHITNAARMLGLATPKRTRHEKKPAKTWQGKAKCVAFSLVVGDRRSHLRDDDRVILGDVRSLVEAPHQLPLVVGHVHRRSRQHVRRTDQHRVADWEGNIAAAPKQRTG